MLRTGLANIASCVCRTSCGYINRNLYYQANSCLKLMKPQNGCQHNKQIIVCKRWAFAGRSKVNMRFVQFTSDLKSRDEDFELNDEQWNILRQEIAEEDETFLHGLDFSIMRALVNKPGLSMSYMKYLQNNGMEVSDIVKIQYIENVVDKYEDIALEYITEMKDTEVFQFKLKGTLTLMVAVAKTKEWRLTYEKLHLKKRDYLEGVIAYILNAVLREKNYKMFFEIWNNCASAIMCSGDKYGAVLFDSWEKKHYPIDLLFEVCKLGEVPFTEEQADKIKEYCRNEWKQNVIAEKTRVYPHSQQCYVCKEQLSTHGSIDISVFKEMRQDFVTNVVKQRSIFRTSSPKEFENFIQFMERKKRPYDLVVDACNLMYATRNEFMFDSILKELKRLQENGNYILFIAKKHQKRETAMLQKLGDLFFTTNRSMDDVYIILGALKSGPNCYIITNDQLRDHLNFIEFSLRGYFDKWLFQRNIMFNKKKAVLMWPHVTRGSCHESKTSWHIPYRRDIQRHELQAENVFKYYQQGDFLCLQKPKNYKKSKECKQFIEMKNSVLKSDSVKTIW